MKLIEFLKNLDPFLLGTIFFIFIIPVFIGLIIYIYFYNPKIVMWDWDKIKDADADSLSWRKRYIRDAYLKTLNYDEKTKKNWIILLIAFGGFCELFILCFLAIYLLAYFLN